MKTIVFSDMDGTLLDEHYSFGLTKPAVDQLLAMDTSVVFCSSKTRAEIEFYRKKLCINDPFISENGAAIFIPKNYFSKSYNYTESTDEYNIIELGVSYANLRQKLSALKSKTYSVVGFGDLTVEEVARESGLPLELAVLAKQREYDEPFRIVAGDEKQLIEAAKVKGLCVAKGDRYWHLKGNHSKGTAAKLLIKLYAENFSQIRTAAVGNGPSDLPMLTAVEKPFWVKETERLDKVWCEVVEWVSDTN